MASKARTAAQSSGKMKASLTDYQKIDWKKRHAEEESQWKSKEFGKQVGLMADTLSLASTLYGSMGDKKSDIKTLEKEYGAMEGPKDYGKDFLGKLRTEGARIGRDIQLLFGQGEYKFGDKTISGSELSGEAAAARGLQRTEEYKTKAKESDLKNPNESFAEENENILKPDDPIQPKEKITEGVTSPDVIESEQVVEGVTSPEILDARQSEQSLDLMSMVGRNMGKELSFSGIPLDQLTSEQLAEWKKAGYFNPELDEDAYQQYANWYNRQG